MSSTREHESLNWIPRKRRVGKRAIIGGEGELVRFLQTGRWRLYVTMSRYKASLRIREQWWIGYERSADEYGKSDHGHPEDKAHEVCGILIDRLCYEKKLVAVWDEGKQATIDGLLALAPEYDQL